MLREVFFLLTPAGSEGPKKGAAQPPHFCRMLPTKLDRPERVASGRTTKGFPCPLDGARQTEGTGWTQNAECIEFPALAGKHLQGMANPCDIRRAGTGDGLGAKNHLGAVSPRHFSIDLAIGATDHGLENAAAKRGGNGVGHQRMARQGTDIFTADSFGSGPGGNQSHEGRRFLFHATGG